MAQPTFTPRDIYRSFRAERNEALHPVLRRLPDRFLAALIEGLEQADVITPGRLFAGDRGGCAVGVTLRVLNPGYRGRRLIWGRRLRKSITRMRCAEASEISHLYALEQVFDRSVLMLQRRFDQAPAAEVAIATAHWIAGEARVEMLIREMDSQRSAPVVETAAPRVRRSGRFTQPALAAV